MARELKAALRLVWLAIALVTMAAASAPFLLSERVISGLAPVCESKRRYGRECFLCGATTGFIAVGRGDWTAARRANRLAVPLFLAFPVNGAAAIAYFGWRVRAGRRLRRERL